MAISTMAWKRRAFAALLLWESAASLALGVWQIERRAWKLHLIAAVNARAHGAPVRAPGPAAWGRVSAEREAYRHVTVSGRFDNFRATRVEAVTGRGPGGWLMTPLRTDEGWTILINRGFLPDGGLRASSPTGEVTVTGLLRVTEPKGTFLRPNDPPAGHWYSRDVSAIANARGLGAIAPYFIDADATPEANGYPIAGLTVIAFRNAHLSYAITWFALAGLSVYGLMLLLRDR